MSQINSSQALILKVLAKAPGGLSYEEIKTKVGEGVAVNSGTIGPVHREVLNNYPDSLHALNLVRVEKTEGEGTKFLISPKGLKVATSLVARKRVSNGSRVPPKLLDPLVRKLMEARTYGIDGLTSADLSAIRKDLGENWAKIADDDLRQQITNRRKSGAYANPNDKILAAVKETVNRFGPEGKVIQGLLTQAQLSKLDDLVKSLNKA